MLTWRPMNEDGTHWFLLCGHNEYLGSVMWLVDGYSIRTPGSGWSHDIPDIKTAAARLLERVCPPSSSN